MAHWFQTADRFRDPTAARRIATYVDLLSRFRPGHLVDLGAGHGVFSKIAADLGWRVTAVDVRSARFPDDDRITWVTQDVRTFDRYADVDLVVNLGLWYHLTLADQRRLAARVAPRPMILDTHVARPELISYSDTIHPRVTPLVRRSGFQGRYFSEEGLQGNNTASWGNDTSFWPTVPSLERQMWEAGYEVVEQISPPYLPDRGFFVARMLGAAGGTDLDDVVGRYVAQTSPAAALTTEPLLSLTPEPLHGVKASTAALGEALRRSAKARLAPALRKLRG